MRYGILQLFLDRVVIDALKKGHTLEKYTEWLQEIFKSVQYGNECEQLLAAAEIFERAGGSIQL